MQVEAIKEISGIWERKVKGKYLSLRETVHFVFGNSLYFICRKDLKHFSRSMIIK